VQIVIPQLCDVCVCVLVFLSIIRSPTPLPTPTECEPAFQSSAPCPDSCWIRRRSSHQLTGRRRTASGERSGRKKQNKNKTVRSTLEQGVLRTRPPLASRQTSTQSETSPLNSTLWTALHSPSFSTTALLHSPLFTRSLRAYRCPCASTARCPRSGAETTRRCMHRHHAAHSC
jgi:hypothetical protein